MKNKILITVARQYGSGGREIGEKTAELLGIQKYDKELITLAAQNTDIHEDVLTQVDEKAANSLLYTLAMGSNIYGTAHLGSYHLPINDRLFLLQSDVLRDIAKRESAVIIGRCADYVLREEASRFSIFIYAPLEERKKRIMERHPELSATEALNLIHKTDRRRMSYYNFYTGGKWGKLDNYHLSVDSSKLGIDGTAEMIAALARKLMAE